MGSTGNDADDILYIFFQTKNKKREKKREKKIKKSDYFFKGVNTKKKKGENKQGMKGGYKIGMSFFFLLSVPKSTA